MYSEDSLRLAARTIFLPGLGDAPRAHAAQDALRA